MSSHNFAPTESRFWVQGWRRDPAVLQELGTVEDLGEGLVRIDVGR